MQAIVASVLAAAGVVWVHQRRKLITPPAMPSPDLGQPVTWEAWIDQSQTLARVSYRGASWEARVTGECAGEPGEMLYISAVHGNTLEVTKTRPA